MSGDFERWDNRPAETKAPKPDPVYLKERQYGRMAKRAVQIGLVIIIILFWMLWMARGRQ